jgi:mannose-6-phosphate isomerase-like protein (cupin superfamily)
MQKINLKDKLNLFTDYWNPRIVGELNGQHVKLAKFKGEFVMHSHEHEDELFFIVKGRLLMRFKDKDVWLEEGEMIIVPAKVEHQPIAPEEVHVMLFEPKSTLNTGNVVEERTRNSLEFI